jgi:hypothetical protein
VICEIEVKPSSLEGGDEYREQFKQQIQRILNTLPVYYLVAEYDSFPPLHFFRFPNPGMIAFLLHRHKLHLNECLFVSSSSSSKVCEEMAASIGLNSIDEEHFFSNNGWTAMSKMYPSSSSFNSKYVSEDNLPKKTLQTLHNSYSNWKLSFFLLLQEEWKMIH